MLALRDDRGGRAVLRLITREPWRTHGAALSTRESEVPRMLAGTDVPAPRSIALDADGRACEHPAHLMTLVPGETDVGRVDPASLAALADLLATIHGVVPTVEVRPYQSWAWEAKFVVPGWARHRDVWERAFDILRAAPPPFEPTFLHRDFALRNVLWHDGAVSGVVDWVETSIGPAWLDVAHCSTNIALDHGNAAADAFADAYVSRTGREPARLLGRDGRRRLPAAAGHGDRSRIRRCTHGAPAARGPASRGDRPGLTGPGEGASACPVFVS